MILDRDDGFTIPAGPIYALLLTPRGLVAVSEEVVTKRPAFEVVVPFPKARSVRRR
jgi:hypothetical protein